MEEDSQLFKTVKDIAVIIAHPDDETLWCGGTMLQHKKCRWHVACLCRGNDPDRAPKFKEALKLLNATGAMGDIDDGPEQFPLDIEKVKSAILALLPHNNFDLIIAHSPLGEYTRHLRHEEVGRAVIELWKEKKINVRELWLFAYEDGDRKYRPIAIMGASIYHKLPRNIWKEKYRIITEIYGFGKDGFESETTPEIEAFWKFNDPLVAEMWLK